MFTRVPLHRSPSLLGEGATTVVFSRSPKPLHLHSALHPAVQSTANPRGRTASTYVNESPLASPTLGTPLCNSPLRTPRNLLEASYFPPFATTDPTELGSTESMTSRPKRRNTPRVSALANEWNAGTLARSALFGTGGFASPMDASPAVTPTQKRVSQTWGANFSEEQVMLPPRPSHGRHLESARSVTSNRNPMTPTKAEAASPIIQMEEDEVDLLDMVPMVLSLGDGDFQLLNERRFENDQGVRALKGRLARKQSRSLQSSERRGRPRSTGFCDWNGPPTDATLSMRELAARNLPFLDRLDAPLQHSSGAPPVFDEEGRITERKSRSGLGRRLTPRDATPLLMFVPGGIRCVPGQGMFPMPLHGGSREMDLASL